VPPDHDPHAAPRIATVCALLVVASFVASKAARDAILLAQFDIKTLPIFIAISAAISLPAIVAAGRLMTRYGPARLMPVLNAVSALLGVVEWALLQRYPRPVSVIVYFHLATSGAVLVSGFWSIVNERFDVQSAKRHIGLIGMGATLGGIFGGLAAERTAVYLSPDKILLVLAGLQLICAVTLLWFGAAAHREPVVTAQEGFGFALRVVARSRLLRNLGAIVVLGAIAAGIMDYVFKADIVAGSARPDLLRSLAIFYTVTSVITAIIQLAVCGPLIAWLGVPRSVTALPLSVAAFGAVALAIPHPLAAAVARGAEAVTRNSIYRSSYELLFAPLPEEHKRPTKVVLDVGADRIGDILGAQLVGLIVYVMAAPRLSLLFATVVVGALGVVVALRLPRSYTMALEDSLLSSVAWVGSHPSPIARRDARWGEWDGSAGPQGTGTSPVDRGASTPTEPALQPEPWMTISGMPRAGTAEDLAVPSSQRPDRAPAQTAPAPQRDPVVDAIIELRSGDLERIKRALDVELSPELASHAIALVARDDVAREALRALGALAPRCTGVLVDALLDEARDVAVRRRLPGVLVTGEPTLAAWGLWHALGDPSFEVRYRSGAVLSRIVSAGNASHLTAEEIFDAVRRELAAGRGVLDSHLADELASDGVPPPGDDLSVPAAGTGLEHIFTMLGLVLPPEPLRIALHAVQTDDPELRGTALEYLESILPADVRAQLWPLLEGEAEPATAGSEEAALPAPGAAAISLPTPDRRTREQLLAALNVGYPSVIAKLRQRRASA